MTSKTIASADQISVELVRRVSLLADLEEVVDNWKVSDRPVPYLAKPGQYPGNWPIEVLPGCPPDCALSIGRIIADMQREFDLAT